MADRPTISQRSTTPAPRAAGTPANAPPVVSEERALALGLPGGANGVPGAQAVATPTLAASTPQDFAALTVPDQAATLAARPADTSLKLCWPQRTSGSRCLTAT
ncbi:MAG: hypothetical protein ACXW16_12280 [Burkholderiaceae bacterium]